VGLDCIILALIIYVVDFMKVKKGTRFFLVTGKNPLFIYLMSELGVTLMWLISIGDEPLYSWIYLHVFSYAGGYIGSLLFAIWWMLTCWSVGYFLDKKKIYIKL